jgi:hypothetical protein
MSEMGKSVSGPGPRQEVQREQMIDATRIKAQRSKDAAKGTAFGDDEFRGVDRS